MNVPRLRFKDEDGREFPEWVEKIMGDTLSIFSGYAFSSNHSQSNGVKWLKIADVGIQQMIPSNPSYLPFELKDKHRNFLVFKDDYVIALTRPILNGNLKIARVDQNYDGSLLNQRVGKLISNEVIDFVYFLLQLKNTVTKISDTISGTDPPNLSLYEIKGIKLKIPRDREEQTKIANFLTAIDEKISQLTQKNDLLKQYKKGVMQRIFSQKLRFKDEDGQEFPEWETVRLGDIASFSKGKGISKADIATDGKTLCIRYGELYTEYGETIQKIKSKTNVNPEELQLSESNDVIIPASGETQIDIAKASCVLVRGVALGGDINIIKSNENGIFLSYYLNHQKRLDIAKLAQGNSVVHLYSSQLKLLDLIIPSNPEQTKIANFLTAIDDKITQAQTQLDAVKQYKKGLLQQLFV